MRRESERDTCRETLEKRESAKIKLKTERKEARAKNIPKGRERETKKRTWRQIVKSKSERESERAREQESERARERESVRAREREQE